MPNVALAPRLALTPRPCAIHGPHELCVVCHDTFATHHLCAACRADPANAQWRESNRVERRHLDCDRASTAATKLADVTGERATPMDQRQIEVLRLLATGTRTILRRKRIRLHGAARIYVSVEVTQPLTIRDVAAALRVSKSAVDRIAQRAASR